MVKKLKVMANYVDSRQRKERLPKIQDHHSLYQGLLDNSRDTRVTIITKMFQQFLFYYLGLKLFRDKIKSDLD